MKIFHNTAIAALVFLGGANAGSVIDTKVVGAACGYFQKPGSSPPVTIPMCYVTFDKDLINVPTCATAVNNNIANKRRLMFSMDEIGKGVLAIALSAKATGTFVDAYGKNLCSIWNPTNDIAEDLGSLILKQ